MASSSAAGKTVVLTNERSKAAEVEAYHNEEVALLTRELLEQRKIELEELQTKLEMDRQAEENMMEKVPQDKPDQNEVQRQEELRKIEQENKMKQERLEELQALKQSEEAETRLIMEKAQAEKNKEEERLRRLALEEELKKSEVEKQKMEEEIRAMERALAEAQKAKEAALTRASLEKARLKEMFEEKQKLAVDQKNNPKQNSPQAEDTCSLPECVPNQDIESFRNNYSSNGTPIPVPDSDVEPQTAFQIPTESECLPTQNNWRPESDIVTPISSLSVQDPKEQGALESEFVPSEVSITPNIISESDNGSSSVFDSEEKGPSKECSFNESDCVPNGEELSNQSLDAVPKTEEGMDSLCKKDGSNRDSQLESCLDVNNSIEKKEPELEELRRKERELREKLQQKAKPGTPVRRKSTKDALNRIETLKAEEARLRAELESKKASNSFQSNSNLDETVTTREGNSRYFPLEAIRNKSIPGLDYTKREQYLSPSDFQSVFGCSKEEFLTWPKWKQKKVKLNVRLF